MRNMWLVNRLGSKISSMEDRNCGAQEIQWMISAQLRSDPDLGEALYDYIYNYRPMANAEAARLTFYGYIIDPEDLQSSNYLPIGRI